MHNLSCFANVVLSFLDSIGLQLTGISWSGYCKARDNRLVLPACVVQAIRAHYPAPDGQYRGYQETVDAGDEL